MQARYWETKDGQLQCHLCPHNCVIPEGKVGRCGNRINHGNKLYSLNYGKAVSINCDPVEKKPLYHFMPGTLSLSIGTAGCNLGCMHCQNWEISTAKAGELQEYDLPPEVVVQLAIDKGCKSISYTYNEPTIFHEYATDIAKLAKERGLKNIIVTNGYINPGPAKEFAELMDAANVDLKAFNDKFYKEICGAKLQPVLETIKIYKKLWLEITNLIIDGKNDSMQEIEEMCKWIKENVGEHVPLHFSRAFPMNKMQDIQPTPKETLLKAKSTAQKHLNYVYIGNIYIQGTGNTYCPDCAKLVIDRENLSIANKTCECGKTIEGIWD
ncbi:MAG: AmmeMemoRadiSam system radical SAM enzyme [Candidatus Nanoarchaeia archaeon]